MTQHGPGPQARKHAYEVGDLKGSEASSRSQSGVGSPEDRPFRTQVCRVTPSLPTRRQWYVTVIIFFFGLFPALLGYN